MPDVRHAPSTVDISAYRLRTGTERDTFRGHLADPALAQHRVLADVIEFNAGTAFGRAHGFQRLRSLKDFRRAVPIHDYDGLRPWIERAAAGEPGVLSADPALVFFTSSGSTGDHKKIPVTGRFMRSVFFPFYFTALAAMVEYHPEAVADPDATLNLKYDLPARPATTSSGRPHVGASQVDLGKVFGEPLAAEPGSRASWASLSVPVADDDHLGKAYLRLRLAVEHDVRAVIGINPAMVAALPRQLDDWWPRIVRDLRDGTLDGRPGGTANRDLAARLEKLASAAGTLRPADVWPNFRLIYCWASGLASLYLPQVKSAYGTDVEVMPAPVAASEGPLGVPVDRHPTAGPPALGSVLYEFIDADEEIRPDSATLTVSDLKPGRDYHAIITHVGGLYRYALGDVVRAMDPVAGVVRLGYAGRNQRSDAAGEALRESQVIDALTAALKRAGRTVANATSRVRSGPAGLPRYTFLLALDDGAPNDGGRDDGGPADDRLAATLDTELCRVSPRYRRARAERRLDPSTVERTAPDAFYREWTRRVAAGTRQTQVKDRVFTNDEAVWQRLRAADRAELADPAGLATVDG